MNVAGTLSDDIKGKILHARTLIFDFDGTLVDSNPIKWRAFEECFSEFNDWHDEISSYCRQNNHTTREEKFSHVYENILRLPYTSMIKADLLRRFVAATTTQIIAAPEISGANKFLRLVSESHITALLSSTPHDTLLQILEERRWRGYFKFIRGAPVNKTIWLREFRKERGLGENDMVYFGDTPEDAEAAADSNCIFVAVANETSRLEILHYIRDFTSLLSLF